MEFIRGVRSKVFSDDVQLEKEPTLLFGIFLTPSSVGTAGKVRCYDGWGTTGELIAEFQASYDFGTCLRFPIQFPHACYIDLVSGLDTITISWLTNEQAMSMFHNELEIIDWHREKVPHSLRDALRIMGV